MLPLTAIKEPPTVVLSTLQPKYPHELLDPMQFHIDYTDTELRDGFQFEIKIRDTPRDRINPKLRLASPDDAESIVKIVEDDYEGSYPYKEMEDSKEVKRMIESEKYKFVVFLNDKGKIIGTTCFVLYFEEKVGYLRTFVVKKEWLGLLDATKAYVASFVAICNRYKGKILLWWGEARTADAKSQYINRLCSLRPIAFLPNKDFFYNRVESDLIMTSYSKEMFSHNRSLNQPRIIPRAIPCYTYTDLQYDLGTLEIEYPQLDFKTLTKKAKSLENNLVIYTYANKFGYITYRFSLNMSNSYFQFLYTPRVNNFEKVYYKVNSLADLYTFVKKFSRIGKDLGIRYMESYVSAYKPKHQQIFTHLGFTPRGYLPAWRLNRATDKFEDYLVFNWYRGPLVDYETIPEGSSLIKYLNMEPK